MHSCVTAAAAVAHYINEPWHAGVRTHRGTLEYARTVARCSTHALWHAVVRTHRGTLEYARTLGGSSLLSTLEMDLRKGLRARSADSDDARYLAPRCEAETNRTHKITKL